MNDDAMERAIRLAHDQGFDEGYQAREMEDRMTYVLCGVVDCMHHDGDGCTLENAQLARVATSRALLAVADDGYAISEAVRRLPPACMDYEEAEEG